MVYRGLPVSANGWVDVSSSCLSRIRVQGGRYAAGVTLTVEFATSGARYQARSVPHEVVADLLTAPSIGIFYNDHLKSNYRWVRV